MTELIYFRDCYKKEFDAEVLGVKGSRVILDKTAFYPEGGGQPSDTGKIGNSRIKKVEKNKGVVEHVLENNPFEIGETVHCRLDWDRRYSHMRYHTAQHVLSAVVLEKYEGRTTGNQIYEDRAHIDFDVDISDKKGGVEEKVNSIIDKERDVDIYTMTREKALEELDKERTRIDLLPDSIEEFRIVEIKKVDKTACAGTHVKNTGELEGFNITDTVNKGKDRKRVEFELAGNKS